MCVLPEETKKYIYIIFSVFCFSICLKSGESGQDQALHSLWGSEGTNAQSNVLLLQQPGITVSPLHVLTPPLRRADGRNKKNKSMYLPILNSYPRIAPNLNKKPPEEPPASRGCSSAEHSLSKRVCTEETKEDVSISTQGPDKQHPDKRLERHSQSHSHSFMHLLSFSRDAVQKSSRLPSTGLEILGTSACLSPSSPVPSSKPTSQTSPFPSSCSEPAAHSLPSSKVSSSAGSVPDPNTGLTRHRRFLNTVEILSQSGLLDITLRTQELLRQSAATEQNITQLRQHTHLLCQAVQAGSSVPTLEKIHRTMIESGCYPNLRRLLFMGSEDGEPEADSSSKIETMISCRCGFNEQGEDVASSSHLTTEPVREAHQQEWSGVCGVCPSHNKLLMPPDSSTCVPAAVDTHTNGH